MSAILRTTDATERAHGFDALVADLLQIHEALKRREC